MDTLRVFMQHGMPMMKHTMVLILIAGCNTAGFDNHINGERLPAESWKSKRVYGISGSRIFMEGWRVLPTITREVMNGMFSRSFRLSDECKIRQIS